MDKTLSSVAEAVGVSTSYISAVERGRRAPFQGNKLTKLALCLGADLEELKTLAAKENTRFELKADPGSFRAEVAQALARGWDELDESQLRSLEGLLHGLEGKNKGK